MRLTMRKAILAGAFLAAVGGGTTVALANEDVTDSPAELKTIMATPTKLSDAIKAAEQKAGGQATEASTQVNNGAVTYTINVAANGNEQEVMVNGADGKVLSVSPANRHDGNNGGENDSENGGENNGENNGESN